MYWKRVSLAALALSFLAVEVQAQSRALFRSRSGGRSILTSGRQVPPRTARLTDKNRSAQPASHPTHYVETEATGPGCASCGGGGCATCCPPLLSRCCIPILPAILDELDCVVRAVFSCARPSCGPHCDIRDPAAGPRVLLPGLSRRQCCDDHGPREVWIEGTPLPKPAPNKVKPTPAKKTTAYRSYMPSLRYRQKLSYRRGSALSYRRPRTTRPTTAPRYRQSNRTRQTASPKRYTYTYPRRKQHDDGSVGTSVRRPSRSRKPTVADRTRTIRRQSEPSYRSVRTSPHDSRIRRTSVSEGEIAKRAPRRIDVDEQAKPIRGTRRTASGRKVPVNPLRGEE